MEGSAIWEETGRQSAAESATDLDRAHDRKGEANTVGISQVLTCTEVTWESCETADSDSGTVDKILILIQKIVVGTKSLRFRQNNVHRLHLD